MIYKLIIISNNKISSSIIIIINLENKTPTVILCVSELKNHEDYLPPVFLLIVMITSNLTVKVIKFPNKMLLHQRLNAHLTNC